MDERLDTLQKQFLEEGGKVKTAEGLAALKDKYLGRKSGLVGAEKKRIGAIPAEERAEFGRQVNELGAEVEQKLEALASQFAAAAERAPLERDAIDRTLPGTAPKR